MHSHWQIFRQAFKTIWQSPGFWFFGIFTALLGTTGELDLILNSYGFGGDGIFSSFWQGLVDAGLFTGQGLNGVKTLLFTQPVYLFITLLLFLSVLAVAVFIVWLAIVSQGAMISQAVGVAKGQAFGFKRGFGAGLRNFWPVLSLNVLLRIALGLSYGFLWFLALINFKGAAVIFVLGFILFFAAILAVSFVGRYAICGVVLKGEKVFSAIKSGWSVFSRNWAVSLEITAILAIIYLVIDGLLFFATGSVLFYLLGVYADFFFGLIVIYSFLLLAFLAIQIGLSIFYWSVWAIVFELLTSNQSKPASFLGSIFKK